MSQGLSVTSRAHQRGFSLVELSIVLVIVALISSGLIFSLSGQQDQLQAKDAQRQLATIQEALLGYAMTNGRLPCPAPANLPTGNTGAGQALAPPCTNANQYGVIPWVTLGLPETDPWGNRFTYFVSQKFTAALTGSAQASFTLTTGSPNAVPADNAGTANILNNGTNVASDLPAVIVSHGKRGAGAFTPSGSQIPGAVGDEAENADNDLSFVSRTPNDSFDDQVTWIIPSVLKSRMVAVGKLP